MRRLVRAIAFFAAIFIYAHGAAAQQAEQLVILRNANMRIQPEMDAAVAGSLPAGTIVPIIEKNSTGTWFLIKHNGVEGWIFHGLTQRVQQRAQAGDVFTKQDASMLPPGAPVDIDADVPKQKYAQILQDNILIRAILDPQSPIIHKARRAEVFPLVSEGDSWCRVEVTRETSDGETAKDTGWVKRSDIEILDTMPDLASIVKGDAKKLIIVLLVLIGIILIISIVMTLRHIKAGRDRVFVRKNALILAKESKTVISTLTNAASTMERCFSEIGFTVNVVKDSVSARNSIASGMPDLILVDWNFEPSIFAKIENLFARMSQADTTYFIFYNVPDPSAVPPGKILRNVSFLGLTVTDRDLFKKAIVQSSDDAQNFQKSVQRCALEGEIAGGNLLEVLQFIEIGSKTGGLMVMTKGPFGVVYFGDGRIIYAATNDCQGVEAVYAILNLPSGKFRFITNKQPKAANLNLPTLSVLMEWTKNKDEAHR